MFILIKIGVWKALQSSETVLNRVRGEGGRSRANAVRVEVMGGVGPDRPRPGWGKPGLGWGDMSGSGV